MQSNEIIPLERLSEERYSRVLCYPKPDSRELKRRLKELEKLRVVAVEFIGDKNVSDTLVLGKGSVGVVVVAHTERGRAALKIRRVDAPRAGMQHETRMLKEANAVGVGPDLLGAAENFLLMEFVNGKLLPQWIEELEGRGTRSKIRKALRMVLEQCWTLDEVGLDHGQLSRAPKHIIVDESGSPDIVDFETASVIRRVSNVTSICQYLFIGSQVAKKIRRKLGEIDQAQLIGSLKNYKKRRRRENFEKILGVCGLHKV